jgi:hypothetical protein
VCLLYNYPKSSESSQDCNGITNFNIRKVKRRGKFLKKKYTMLDFESYILVNFFIDKLSNQKGRDSAKQLLLILIEMVPVNRIFSLLVCNCLTKTTKVKCECLDICAEIVRSEDANQGFIKDIKVLVKHMGNSDQLTKNAILSVLIEMYVHLGEDFWDLLSDASDKLYEYIHSKINDLDIEVDTAYSKGLSSLKSSKIFEEKSKAFIKPEL